MRCSQCVRDGEKACALFLGKKLDVLNNKFIESFVRSRIELHRRWDVHVPLIQADVSCWCVRSFIIMFRSCFMFHDLSCCFTICSPCFIAAFHRFMIFHPPFLIETPNQKQALQSKLQTHFPLLPPKKLQSWNHRTGKVRTVFSNDPHAPKKATHSYDFPNSIKNGGPYQRTS